MNWNYRKLLCVITFCLAIALSTLTLVVGAAQGQAGEVTLQGSVVCTGACIPDPKMGDHGLVVFAIDGTDEVRATVKRLMKDFYPDKGLDAEAAQKLIDQFSKLLKYHISPDSPALKEIKNKGKNHYCMPATSSAVTGAISEKDGKKWITATRITSCKLKYPEKMLAADRPFVMPGREPLILKVGDKQTLKCVHIPSGKFLMGTPFYMWPYHIEEYPHQVTLTRDYYMGEIPVTQEMYEAVMGKNPSLVEDPRLPVQNPAFKDIDKFCDMVSKQNGKKGPPADLCGMGVRRPRRHVQPAVRGKVQGPEQQRSQRLQVPLDGQVEEGECLGTLRHGQLLVGDHG